MTPLIGHETSSLFGSDHTEAVSWIGKPWRRLELQTNRIFYKGEEIDRTRSLDFHLGLRRLGLAFTFSVTRAAVLDYSEERQ